MFLQLLQQTCGSPEKSFEQTDNGYIHEEVNAVPFHPYNLSADA